MAAARPHNSCTATLQQPPARNEGRPAKSPVVSRRQKWLRHPQQRATGGRRRALREPGSAGTTVSSDFVKSAEAFEVGQDTPESHTRVNSQFSAGLSRAGLELGDLGRDAQACSPWLRGGPSLRKAARSSQAADAGTMVAGAASLYAPSVPGSRARSEPLLVVSTLRTCTIFGMTDICCVRETVCAQSTIGSTMS